MLSVLPIFFLAVLTERLMNSPNLVSVPQSHPVKTCVGCFGSPGECEGPGQWHLIADIPLFPGRGEAIVNYMVSSASPLDCLGARRSPQAVEPLDGQLPLQEMDFGGSQSHLLKNSISHLYQCVSPSLALITPSFSDNEFFCVMYFFLRKEEKARAIDTN